MKRIYNKFLIISTVALVLGGAYMYFSNDLSSTEIVPKAFGSSLTSSSGVISDNSSSLEKDKISADIAFLTTLVSLKKIKIDTSLFTNKSFNKLQNNMVKIEQVTPGRINPFAMLGVLPGSSISPTSTSTSKVVTDAPTQITEKSAVLNGTINAVTSSTDSAYFEYGPTPTLGTTTPIVKQSLVGTFIKSVLGLTSKTDYFYKACAKINNTVACGEVVSFTTN